MNELNEKPDDCWLLKGMCSDWPTLQNQFLHLHIFHLTMLPDGSEMPCLPFSFVLPDWLYLSSYLKKKNQNKQECLLVMSLSIWTY